MAIYSSSSGVTKLTEADSAKLRDQVTYGRPNKAAISSLSEGRKLLNAIHTKRGGTKPRSSR